jgi:hypothetical protein
MIGFCLSPKNVSGGAAGVDSAAMQERQQYIAQIKRPDKEMRNHSGESMRSFYVARLCELDRAVLDAGTQGFIVDLIEKDADEWVRLEAAGEVAYLPLTAELIPRVTRLLEKCRKDERVNFQVLASQSLLRIGKKRNRTNVAAEKTLAGIAQGRNLAKWKVMIPAHNVGTMAMDPSSKTQIPIEEFFKMTLRNQAIVALSLAKDDFSKKTLTDLAKDSNTWVSETAHSALAH